MRLTLLSAAVLTAGFAAGCSLYFNEGDDGDDAPTSRVETQVFPAGPGNRNLDLLFVMDNSGSMGEEQLSIAANFAQFASGFATTERGLPNVHVGVISTNMGSGGVNIGGCSSASRPFGDNGQLLTNGCPGLAGSFISDIANVDGSRTRNYNGDLSALFGCMARLGTIGCGFEQPLESMFTALQPGVNPGFLRDDARLGIIFVGDEDDCSALPGGAMFGDPSATIASPLGPRTSFRCFEFGVECTNDPNPRAFGTRAGCLPRVQSQFMQPVSRYVDFVRSLKLLRSDVIVAGIIGAVDEQRSANVLPDPDDATRPALAPACTSASGVAFPGFRLSAFLASFPGHNATTSICNENLADPLLVIAEDLKTALGVPCFENPLADRDPALAGMQAECAVTEFIEVNGVRVDQVVVPECGTGAGVCWRLLEDRAACPTTGFTMRIEGHSTMPPPNALVEAQCVIQ